MRVWVVVAALALASCATPYQETGFRGGVSAQRIDETTLQVSASGNGMTNVATIQQFLLRRSAEATLAAGYDHFVFVNIADQSRAGAITTPGSANSYTTANVTGFGNTAYGTANTSTTYTPPQTFNFTKPGALAIVRMYKGADRPDGFTGHYYDAADVLKYMAP